MPGRPRQACRCRRAKGWMARGRAVRPPAGPEVRSEGVERIVAGPFEPSGCLARRCRSSGGFQVLPGHTDEVFASVFHPDGTRLATAGRDRAVWLWDLAKGEEVARLDGHANFVWSLAFSPDGKTVVSGSGDNTVRLWDTEPLRVRHEARRAVEALRPEAERLVDRLFREKEAVSSVVKSLKEDGALSQWLRRAAFHALWRRRRPNP